MGGFCAEGRSWLPLLEVDVGVALAGFCERELLRGCLGSLFCFSKAKGGGRWRLVLVSRVAAAEKMKAWVFYLSGGCRGRKVFRFRVFLLLAALSPVKIFFPPASQNFFSRVNFSPS
jgi:hypothetical protein